MKRPLKKDLYPKILSQLERYSIADITGILCDYFDIDTLIEFEEHLGVELADLDLNDEE